MNQHVSSSRTVRLGRVEPQALDHRTIFCNDRQANLPIRFKQKGNREGGQWSWLSRWCCASRLRRVTQPNLSALIVEEINEFSATSSPNKSPSWSLDKMPIIGTVGIAEMLLLAFLRILARPLPLEEFQTQEVLGGKDEVRNHK